MKNYLYGAVFLLASCSSVKEAVTDDVYQEPHRPQAHFSPKANWMNDPNGMVFNDGIYHLFFQYYPDSTVWGPMHWGHATSTDLVHWNEEEIALYPDSLGYIFSGSAVIDKNNTSGFGKGGIAPMVAIFTHHDPVGAKQNTGRHESQSIAYSLDNGKTWTKYSGNPVLKNPGIKDFRDPKVMWYEEGNKWIMTLATLDRITFYSSPDLKNWTKESEIGKDFGAHGGVWECPDLFQLDNNGKKVWVLIVNINPGGPNGGSATQYFLGDFDGHEFKPYSKETKWMDYGPDEYAGVTWSNTGDRKIFLGWMSNWLYANVVPTDKWRSAMTVPRELKLTNVNGDMRVASVPVSELQKIEQNVKSFDNVSLSSAFDVASKVGGIELPGRLSVKLDNAASFSVVLSNDVGEKVVIGFDKNNNQYFVDRTAGGKSDFHKEFAAKHTAPRFSNASNLDMTLIIDVSSVELFADDGLSVMTEIFFPTKPFNQLKVESASGATLQKLEYADMKKIWQ